MSNARVKPETSGVAVPNRLILRTCWPSAIRRFFLLSKAMPGPTNSGLILAKWVTSPPGEILSISKLLPATYLTSRTDTPAHALSYQMLNICGRRCSGRLYFLATGQNYCYRVQDRSMIACMLYENQS